MSIKMLAFRLCPVITLLFSVIPACDQQTGKNANPLSLIPEPLSVENGKGYFTLYPGTRIVICPGTPEAENIGHYLAGEISFYTGLKPEVETGDTGEVTGAIVFRLSGDSDSLGKEGYKLTILRNKVLLTASAPAGLFYAVQTLLQLLPVNPVTGKEIAIPVLSVYDRPAFTWRGMHLDVSRHFFPVSFIKKYIDILAMHKMNVLHWHLVDDQGWRIEIKKYPLLTEKAAWREGTGTEPWDYFIGPAVDGKPKYGGFYTHEEIKEIVAYAAGRFVTIVPEIEMPGHARAALDAYPEMYCTGRPFKRDESLPWEFTDPFCAGNEKSFAFLEDVLTEVMELFPSKYIHIGGDEAKKTPWEKCSKCKARMKEEGLSNVEELQSYFIRRVGRFLESNNRKMIGWDEIMEGGLAPGAIVMSWRGEEGGIEAARLGHDAVMTPSRLLYFSSPDLSNSSGRAAIMGARLLKGVYDYQPVPDVLTVSESVHILGAQGCLWSENIPVPVQAESQILPRLCALAEVVWLPDSLKDWDDFRNRMTGHYDRLDKRGINFFIPPPGGIRPDNIFIHKQEIELKVDLPGAEIRFTTDGSDPVSTSRLYTEPVIISENSVVKARTFFKNGRYSRVAGGSFRHQDPKQAYEDTSGMQDGIRLNYYEGNISSLDQSSSLQLIGSDIVRDLSMPGAVKEDFFGLEFMGYIRIPAEGVYTFVTVSDDGSRLYLADTLIVDNDGIHGARPVEGQIALSPGYHPLHIIYFDNQYGESLEVNITGPGIDGKDLYGKLYHK